MSSICIGFPHTISAQETWFDLVTGIVSLLVLFRFGPIWEDLDFDICLEVPNRFFLSSSCIGGDEGVLTTSSLVYMKWLDGSVGSVETNKHKDGNKNILRVFTKTSTGAAQC